MPSKRTSNPRSAATASSAAPTAPTTPATPTTPTTPTTPPSPETARSSQSKEIEDPMRSTPSSLKRKLLELTGNHQKCTNSRVRGVRFTRFILDDDDSLVTFCVEGEKVSIRLEERITCGFIKRNLQACCQGHPHGSERHAKFNPKSVFSANVAAMFDQAKPTPATLQRTAWWYFPASQCLAGM